MNAFIGTLFVPNLWVLMQTIQEKYLSRIIKPPKNLLKKSADTANSTPTSGGV